MKTRTPLIVVAGVCGLILTAPSGFSQGALTPPGAPAPTMKSLDQIEARTPITSAPFTISIQGAYYLTGNLYVTGTTNAITVQADQVTIDLNGFGIFGESGSGAAIGVPNPHRNLTVRNGTLEYWGVGIEATNASGSAFEKIQCFETLLNGLSIGANSVVEDCTVTDAALNGGGNGIQTGDGSMVTRCAVLNDFNHDSDGIVVGRGCVIDSSTANANSVGIVTSDGGTLKACSVYGSLIGGIQMGSGCVISGCTALGNDRLGANVPAMSAGTGCSITACTVAGNNAGGISAGDGSTIKQCTVVSNATTGLIVGNGCTIADCTATFNTNGIVANSECTITGCTASQNSGDGIQTSYSCLIKGNTCSSNSRYIVTGGAGIHALFSGNRIEDNVLNSDEFGIKVDGNENVITRNTARASGSANYYLAAGNMVGIITNAPSSSAIFGSTGGSGLGATDPWANFSY